MIGTSDHLLIAVAVLQASSFAVLAIVAFHLHRLRRQQGELVEMIMLGVNLGPWPSDDEITPGPRASGDRGVTPARETAP